QGNVHADLRAATRQQGTRAREVGAGVALLVAEGGAVGAELVVEGVDLRVVLLADVAGARLDEVAGDGGGRAGGERHAPRLVVDAVGRTRRGRRDDGSVGLRDGTALLDLAVALDGLEHPRRRTTYGHEVGMFVVEAIEFREYP